ncbi:MAG: hypothetical protein A2Y37_00545 [Spirochaetes bacterium GWB1_60_80]|nr:MAG: hypothetical protein A2Y37_00545 [Spirochaetes bacterium GWB1_60_80]OHD43492.1 MAG: hypothetical protein A2Y35_14885 [Spirochaetes bacterium GWE1_60_18]HAW86904.1 hypothetical protein [Spirochaetaceae bacterium]HAX37831.1 hypothetical protein [Spirochaetaceae bacterium]HCQ87997.1 hypothetical protein [Spirochaetaceae bacterium]
MQEITNQTVLELVRRLDGVEKATESMYLDLGRIFPAIKSAIDESARQTEAGIKNILTAYRHGASLEQAKRRMDDFIEDSTRFFNKSASKEQSFVSIVEESISELTQLDDIINHVRLDSEEMELVSLNAMTVALKSGSAGKAFSVITDELKRLSSRTIIHANELAVVGSDLLAHLARLRTELGSLETDRGNFFNSITEALTSGFRQLDEQVMAVAEEYRTLAATVVTVRGPVIEIMQGVQVQDIIRQSLDHVRLSLKAVTLEDGPHGMTRADVPAAEALAANTPAATAVHDPAATAASATASADAANAIDEEKLFLAETTRLSATLLEDVCGQLQSSLASFEGSLSAIDDLVSTVNRRKAEWLSGFVAVSGQADLGSLENSYLAGKRKVAQSARHVAEGVKRLEDRFNAVNAILSRFNNIVIASRIEIARNKALGLVANTVAGMMDLTQRLSQDVSSAGQLTRSFSKTMGDEMISYLGGDDGEEQREFDQAMASLRGEFSRLADSRRDLLATATGFQPFAGSFIAALGEARDQTDRIRRLADELSGMQQSLAGYATDLERELGLSKEDTLAGKLNIRNNRLKDIIERFTIFTHRQTANQIANLDGCDAVDEVGVASGEVTLF